MLPKLPLRIEDGPYGMDVVDADGDEVDAVRSLTSTGWPIPDARQAAERRLAELTFLIEAATPKCPIRRGFNPGVAARPWFVWCDDDGSIWLRTEAERDAVYDALVALWHKEHGQ